MQKDRYFIAAFLLTIQSMICLIYLDSNEIIPYLALGSILGSIFFCAIGLIESI